MKSITTTTTLAALAAAAVLLVSACGGSGGSDQGAAAPTGTKTVSIEQVDGVGDVLVNRSGQALYAATQEANGEVVCTGSCTSIWEPLTLDGAKAPTGEASVRAELGTIVRPDGGTQVTFDGRPLYRFVEDPNPGTVTGNGFADSFDGRAFEWHVATSDGISTTSTNSSSGPTGY
jgi:predicted lipoprotein with Yx(FWY)xxD motif